MFGRAGAAQFGRMGIVGRHALPSWLPVGSGNVAPLVYGDFAGGNYWFNSASYASFSAWNTAIGGIFSRASSATYFDSAGVLQTAGNNVARFIYDPVSHASLGLRLTGARTNLALRSQQFDNASWTVINGSVSADGATAPDGTVSADKLIPDGTATSHRISQGVTVANTSVYTQSVYAKAGEYSFLVMSGGPTNFVYFNLTTGVISSTLGTGITAATITSVGSGWYRCTLTYTTTSTSSSVQLYATSTNNASGNSTPNAAGDGTSGIFIWGAQVELGAFASDYIATTTASATEAADSLIIGPTGGLPFTGFSASAGTILLAGQIDSVGSGVQGLYGLSDGTANNRMELFNNSAASKITYRSRVSAANTDVIGSGSVTSGTQFKDAYAFTFAGGRTAYLNGASDASDAAAEPAGMTNLVLGAAANGNPMWGDIAKFGYWTTALSTADQARLST